MKDDTILIIGALVIGGIAAYKISGGVTEAVKDVGQGLGGGINQALAGYGQGIQNIGAGFEFLGAGLGSGFSGIGQGLGGGFYNIGLGTGALLTGGGSLLEGSAPQNILATLLNRQGFQSENIKTFIEAQASPDTASNLIVQTQNLVAQTLTTPTAHIDYTQATSQKFTQSGGSTAQAITRFVEDKVTALTPSKNPLTNIAMISPTGLIIRAATSPLTPTGLIYQGVTTAVNKIRSFF